MRFKNCICSYGQLSMLCKDKLHKQRQHYKERWWEAVQRHSHPTSAGGRVWRAGWAEAEKGRVVVGGPRCAPGLCGGCWVCVGWVGPPSGHHGGGNRGPPHRPPLRSPVMIPGLSSNLRHVIPEVQSNIKVTITVCTMHGGQSKLHKGSQMPQDRKVTAFIKHVPTTRLQDWGSVSVSSPADAEVGVFISNLSIIIFSLS